MNTEFKINTCETCDYLITLGHDIICRRCMRRGNTFLHDEDHYKPTDWYCKIAELETQINTTIEKAKAMDKIMHIIFTRNRSYEEHCSDPYDEIVSIASQFKPDVASTKEVEKP